MRNFIAAAIFGAILLPHAASAATVSNQMGEVLVNQGEGFVKVSGTAMVSAGTQVMVQQGGKAVIAYSSECSVTVGSGRVWTVQDKAPCGAGTAQVDFTGRMNQQAPSDQGVDTTTLVIGGVVVAGGVAAAIILSQDDKKTVSP